MPPMKFPEQLSFNLFTGEEPLVDRLDSAGLGGEGSVLPDPGSQDRSPGRVRDLHNWRDPRVGWGVVLADKAGLSEATLASGDDAPEPIRRLLKERAPAGAEHAPVLRYHASTGANRLSFLRNYADRNAPDISASQVGTESGQIPQYLLIYGGPQEIPWDLQYILNTRCYVGRLDLEEEALDRYVTALMDEFSDAKSDLLKPLIWAVDDRKTSITKLMRDVIAAPLAEDYAGDSDLAAGLRFRDGSQEMLKVEGLVADLAEHQPGLIVTTSHGKTGPLADPQAMGRDLGLLVDAHEDVLDPAALLAAWQPEGAIWYAHACCSAGGDAVSRLAAALPPGSSARTTLEAVAASGARVSPLPRLLLGAQRPLRAFIGQVEPTCDWTLANRKTGQALTGALSFALYNQLYADPPQPVGMALHTCFERVGTLMSTYFLLRTGASAMRVKAAKMAHLLLAALDQESTVILGDPTAILPPLPATG